MTKRTGRRGILAFALLWFGFSASVAQAALERVTVDFGAGCRALNVRGYLDIDGINLIYKTAVRNRKYRDASNASYGNATIATMYRHQGDVYAFFKDIANFNSLDNRGMALQALTNFRFLDEVPGPQCGSGGIINAQWNGGSNLAMFPPRMVNLPEVIGHEFGHGLIDQGSDLVYEKQSGALNESISDFFGVSYRAWLAAGGGMGKTIGEYRVPASMWNVRLSSNLIGRSLSRPASIKTGAPPGHSIPVRYPDHFNRLVHTREDNGGVHINSSIPNHAFFLMSEGGQHRRLRSGTSVEAIGPRKTTRILANAARYLLPRTADFESSRLHFAKSAEQLYGKGSKEWVTVHKAFDAVGIPGRWQMPVVKPQPEPAPKKPAPTPSAPSKQTPKTVPTTSGTPAAVPSKPAPTSPTQDPSAPAQGLSNVVLASVMGVLLLAAALLVILSRPRSTAALGIYQGGNHAEQFVAQQRNVQAQRTPEPSPARVALQLRALDESGNIPLDETLLNGDEGLVIGRAQELVHVYMASRQVSRRHARLWREPDGLHLEDMNSSHGTMVDGRQLRPFEGVVIQVGELVRIAGFSYLLESTS